MKIDEFLQYFDVVKERRKGDYMVRCPTHNDNNPSLHVTDVGNIILIYCFAGCEAKEILKKIGLKFRDLYY